jgi:hypothetical protein
MFPAIHRSIARLAVLPLLILATPSVLAERDPSAEQTGALIQVTMNSTVAVVLDEIPYAKRDEIAQVYLHKPKSFWEGQAKMQVEHANYRLTYREFYYDEAKDSLPLPPQRIWNIKLDDAGPKRTRYQGHDAVVYPYQLATTILTDKDSVATSEPELAQIAGVWDEAFKLPLDPEFLLQRTGYACVDEDQFPPDTADSENARFLFDQECDVETPETAACHLTEPLPKESCVDALKNHVGRVDTVMRFLRLPWDEKLADQVRVGRLNAPDYPDLDVVRQGLRNNRIVYKYIPADSCAIAEGCVGGSGWRRLFLFDASIRNIGRKPLEVGSVEDGSPWRENNVLEFSECHQHYHFNHYGNFNLSPTSPASKRAFCVESTQRYVNSEFSPVAHPYSCEFQGVAAGWGDDYMAGIQCQWFDITDEPIPAGGTKTLPLSFEINPDRFLCEGEPVIDQSGNLLFERTEFVTQTDPPLPVSRARCDFATGWDDNNKKTRRVKIPDKGGFVTAECTRSQGGPLRDCGFEEQAPAKACTPGTQVSLQCQTQSKDPAQVLRVCETSQTLGTGLACMFRDSLANTVVRQKPKVFNFTCPGSRDAAEPGGQYALYVAPLSPVESPSGVQCVRQ